MSWSSIPSTALPIIFTAVVTLLLIPLLPKIIPLTNQFFAWVKGQAGKVNNDYAKGVLERLSSLVQAFVVSYENTKVEELKSLAASGKITYAELPNLLKAMKDDLITKVKGLAQAQGLWNAALFIFANNENDLHKWVDQIVEAHVANLPPSGLQTVSAAAKSIGAAPAMDAAPQPKPFVPVPIPPTP